MTVKLGTNITAQFLRQQFGRAAEDLSTATQRLASGQRIVKPSDDPAGLAIAEKLSNDARIYTQGVRNLNTGISAISIAEGAMSEMASILDRIDELAKQSQNGTLTQTQRNVMQQEVTALQSEWNRIIESTTFNGTQLLTGNNTRLVLQGSEGDSGTLAVQFGEEQLAGGMMGYAGGTTRVSTDSSGNQVALGATIRDFSADGRYILMSSSDTTLVAGDTNGLSDIFIKDTITGLITRVNTDSAGNEALGGASTAFNMSSDGRYVAFSSIATNLVAGDTNAVTDVFIKDVTTGLTTRVSTDSNGNQATGGVSTRPRVSADGRYVVFESEATNLVVSDTNGTRDIFLKDMATGVTTRVNTDSAGNQTTAGADSRVYGISADGRYIVFQSEASNLVAGDTNARQDVFVKDTLTGVTTRVNTDSAGNESGVVGGARAYARGISADGRYVVFHTRASNLVANDTNGQTDVFVKDTLTGALTRVTTDTAGNQATGGIGLSQANTISADGRYVVFTSDATNLVAGDTNGQEDVFVKDLWTGITTRVNTNTAGNEATGQSSGVAISADGRFVAFNSVATNLVVGDTNGAYDAFIKDLTRTGVNQLSGLIVSNRVSAGVTQLLTARARTELTEYRASLGTSLTRINSFVNTLNSATLNLQEAAARIKDADLAEEASRAMAARMRQEVAANLLKQVNVQPSLALMLLKG